MNTLTRRLFLPALAATLLLGTAGARAAAAGIQDDGAFFSDFAKTNATGTINDVSARLHKDIAVQTFATVPEDAKASVLVADKAAANRGFTQWTDQLARSKKVNGVFILLVKQPAHLQVWVGSDTQRQAFTLSDRATLVQSMLKNLGQKKNDDALIDAVNFISTTMNSHRGHAAAATGYRSHTAQKSGTSWTSVIVIALLVWLGFSLVRGLFRSMSGGGGVGAGGMGQPGYGGGGGGGFMQNMMGSMFGAAAGMWMYDHFFSSNSYGASPMDNTHTGTDGGYTGIDSDGSSDGGSFGNDSGGGGFDGGDSGGGDFGGGGGDFGGGGGDF